MQTQYVCLFVLIILLSFEVHYKCTFNTVKQHFFTLLVVQICIAKNSFSLLCFSVCYRGLSVAQVEQGGGIEEKS